MIIKLNNKRQPSLPGINSLTSTSKKTHKRKPTIRPPLLTDTYEQARVIQGIDGVCGVVYEQMKFHTVIQETYKDKEWIFYFLM